MKASRHNCTWTYGDYVQYTLLRWAVLNDGVWSVHDSFAVYSYPKILSSKQHRFDGRVNVNNNKNVTILNLMAPSPSPPGSHPSYRQGFDLIFSARCTFLSVCCVCQKKTKTQKLIFLFTQTDTPQRQKSFSLRFFYAFFFVWFDYVVVCYLGIFESIFM